MGITKLKKAELYYHKSVQEEIAEILQSSGVCQIMGSSAGDISPVDIQSRLQKSEEQLSHIRYLMRTLAGHYADPVSSLDRMLGERATLSLADLVHLANKTELEKASAEVREREQALNELRMEASRLKTNESLLLALKKFPFQLSILTEGTRTLAGITGVLKKDQFDSFKKILNEYEKDTEIFVSELSPSELQVTILYSRSIEAKILEICPRNGLSVVELPRYFKGTATEEALKVTEESAKNSVREAEIAAEITELAEKWMPTVQKLSDYWNSLSSRYRALGMSDETDRTLITRFWVPEEATDKLQKKIETVSPASALVLTDPGEDDTPPTQLKSGKFAGSCTLLTELYSSPVYGDTDPTPLLAPFFFLFFGMCLGDAGYAIVMLCTLGWVFKKYRRIPSSIKDFMKIFVYGAIATFLYGAISGSFFGNFIDEFSFMSSLVPIKNALLLVDPMADPMQVLGISLLLGVIHLMFGLIIAARDCIRQGDYISAICDKMAWFSMVVGLCVFGCSTMGLLPADFAAIGKAMAIVGALLVFWSAGRESKGIVSKAVSGLYALYGITSYLGDILSYSRLLALGFGSAVIGMIINLLGGMAAEMPYVGWLVAVLVIVGGHLFGLVINVLGAFVHPLRLQYVEFFGKFYSGGGSPFEPLTLSGEYVEITRS